MGDGFSIFDPAALLGFIEEVAVNVDTSLYGVISSLSGLAWNGLSDVWGILNTIWGWLKSFFSALLHWLENAARWILQTALPAIQAFIQKILARLKAFLQPLINYIKAQIRFIQQVYNNVVKPFMNFLQRIRAILVIFRLLHIKWATVLDQYIADLENRINSAFLSVEGDLGRVEQWLQFFADPAGVFNPFPFINAAILSITQLYAMLSSLPSSALGAGTLQQQQNMADSSTYSSVQSVMQQRASGSTADDLSRYDGFVQGFNSLGYSWVK
jgi:hypothetical protein